MTNHIVTRQEWLGPFLMWVAYIPELDDEDAPRGIDVTEEGAVDELKWRLEDLINEH
jgi:hypothetical protein